MIRLDADRPVTFCDGLTRRDFLHAGALAPLGLTLAGSESREGRRQGQRRQLHHAVPASAGRATSTPGTRSRSAPAEVRGPFKPIETNVPGIQISEIFPKMAKHADKFSLVRSVYHTATAVHDTGHQMMQTGRLFAGGIEHPHVGCVARLPQGRPRRGAGPRPAAAADRPHRRQPAARPDRRLPRQARTTRSSSTPTRRRRTSRCPTCCRRTTSRRCGPSAGRSCATPSTARLRRVREQRRRQAARRQLQPGLPADVEPEGPRGVRPREGAGEGPRPLRPDALRPVLPAGPAADRGRRALRHRQHVRDGLRRGHLGHPRLAAVHRHQRDGEAGRAELRPGLHARCSKTWTSAACCRTRW